MRTIAAAMLLSAVALAHPMGNFSVSHYARIEVAPGGSKLIYVLDLAEIPSFELLQKWGIPLKEASTSQIKTKAVPEAAEWLKRLVIQQNGSPVSPQMRAISTQVNDGAGAMPVIRVQIDADLDLAPGPVHYQDRNYPDRAGWKEVVVAAGPGAAISQSGHASRDISKALTAYPANAIATPPQDTKTSFTWNLDGSTATATASAAPRNGQPVLPTGGAGNLVRGDFLSQLLSRRQLSWSMILIGLLAAFGLGAMHALSPGHGKTIVAAYLVGSRGTANHAMLLGATVTFTHTISVFALGLGVLFFQRLVQPERIIPVLGALSGLSIVIVGAWLLYQRTRALLGRSHSHAHHHHHHGHEHDHSHEHSHSHGFVHTHTHDGITHSHAVPDGNASLGSLIALGASGGLVPCPSALLLMLSAIGIGRAAFGLGMLVTFSSGLALVLMAIGLVVVYAKDRLPAGIRFGKSSFFSLVPVFSAAIVMMLGMLMTLTALGLVRSIAFIG
jgi:ABC-type nickel/cobalt efflux system permease component RcnA